MYFGFATALMPVSASQMGALAGSQSITFA